jgi:hypothetical protein
MLEQVSVHKTPEDTGVFPATKELKSSRIECHASVYMFLLVSIPNAYGTLY